MNKIIIIAALLLSTCAEAVPTYGKHGLIVSASDLASQAGISILKKGGNAADGAVATAFALAVTRPYFASLGGGGFMVVRFRDKTLAQDYRETAPSQATRDLFIGKDKDASVIGGLAVAVPGNVRGLFSLHKKFGKLTWAADLQPALDLARNGIQVTGEIARLIKEVYGDFSPAGKRIFGKDGKPLGLGETLKQPEFARAIGILQRKSQEGFYTGEMTKDIVSAVEKSHGIIVGEDLEKYQSRWVEPLKAQVMGTTIYTMPPPSSGGTLLLSEMKMAERLKVNELKPYSGQEFHILAEIMRRAFFDRQYLSDPKTMLVKPETLFSDKRVDQWVSTIHPDKKTDFDIEKFKLKDNGDLPHETGNTTHYTVVDRDGNIVSATTTLNGSFGSAVVSEKFGIVLNNEMDDFTTRPGEANMFGLIQGSANEVGPGKTPVSSMTPTIIEKDGKVFLALGSPGGPRIINAVFQVALRTLTSKLNIDQIVQAPRVHHQFLPDKLTVDPTLSPDTKDILSAKGHKVEDGTVARVYAIRLDENGEYEGAFDSRGEGGAAAY